MILILCLDDRNGMLFAGRRQSQDRTVRRDICRMAERKKLWMNAYSFDQFDDLPDAEITVDEAFMTSSRSGEYCFAENVPLRPYQNRIEKIIVYRWNRHYPADRTCDLELKDGWKKYCIQTFPGYSHEKITKEIYIK